MTMNKKTYTKTDIVRIIDREIKMEMERKNKYIKLNGYKGADRFDTAIATLSALYSCFD